MTVGGWFKRVLFNHLCERIFRGQCGAMPFFLALVAWGGCFNSGWPTRPNPTNIANANNNMFARLGTNYELRYHISGFFAILEAMTTG